MRANRLFALLLLAAAGFPAGGCTKKTYRGAPAPPPPWVSTSEPFLLLSITPSDGARDVPEDTRIELTFSVPPDPQTITPTHVKIIDEESNETIQYRVEPEQKETAYALVPEAPLRLPLHPYRIEILPGIRDQEGRELDLTASPVTLPVHFVTRDLPDTKPPFFLYHGLEAEVLGPSSVRLSWFPALDDRSPPSRISYAIYLATSRDGFDFDRPAARPSPGQTQYTVGGLQPNTTYFFVVRALDEAGNEDENQAVISARTLMASGPMSFTILYTADVVGTLEPCG